MFHDLRQAFATPAFAPVRTDLRDDDLLTPDDIAHMLGMSKRWVYETFAIPAKGGIKPMKLGTGRTAPVRWHTWQVRAWIDARYREAGNR